MHSDFAYLLISRDSSKYDVACSHGMTGLPFIHALRLGIDLKLITSGPLLNSTSHASHLHIPNARSDERLAKNKIVNIDSQCAITVRGMVVHVSRCHDFCIEHYLEFRVGYWYRLNTSRDYGSLILLDIREDMVLTERQIRQIQDTCELMARELMLGIHCFSFPILF